MAVLPTGIGPVTGYNIERSLRFNSADSAYLNRTPGSTGNRRTFTFSFWIKRTTIGTTQRIFQSQDDATASANTCGILIDLNNQLEIFEYSSAYRVRLLTTQVFRDVSAWYHIVVAIDTTQATASDRAKLYVNGTQVTTFAATTYPSQNTDLFWNVSGQPCFIGRFFDGATALAYLNAYLTEVHFINGYPTVGSTTYNATTWAALNISTLFGETDSATGVWKPKKYDGTYGTNGFYLKFADNSGTTSTTLGKDSSGNGNNWTPNNFSVTAGVGNDSLVDSPTSYGTDTGVGGTVRGNYATLNPLKRFTANATLSNGNLTASDGSTTSTSAIATMSLPASGKWYWEVTVSASVAGGIFIGACPEANAYGTAVVQTNGSYRNNGTIYNTASATQTSGATYTTNDVIGVAVDVDNGTVQFYKNGTAQGATPSFSFTALTVLVPFIATDNTAGTKTVNCNFGQRAFEKWNGSAYVANTAPSGFKALCTQNLPTPTIGATSTTQANKYMDVTLYTGNGAVRSITNSGSMQPDFVWDKLRSGSNSHRLFDAVRGVEKALYSNLTNAEATETGTLTSFNSNGFSLGTSTETNTNGSTYVAWQWNAGGSNQTISVGQYATSPANVPSIASTVRANTTSGFSIVTFTTNNTAGATVGHGCQVGGVATTPDMIIMKYRGLAANWVVYHKSMNATPQNGYLNLNTTAGYAALIDPWNNTAPSSTVITMGAGAGSAGSTNYSVYTSVAYCFAAVPGYSAFGSYTGNGAADGPFVYTGFRPRYVMIKCSSTTSYWLVLDTARDTYNLATLKLGPSVASVENSSADLGSASQNTIDFLSNGFKLKDTNVNTNQSTATYIYAAFAESPFKYSLAR